SRVGKCAAQRLDQQKDWRLICLPPHQLVALCPQLLVLRRKLAQRSDAVACDGRVGLENTQNLVTLPKMISASAAAQQRQGKAGEQKCVQSAGHSAGRIRTE